jgi:hypothetical protein
MILNFKPTELSNFCRLGETEARIKDSDKLIAIGSKFLSANKLVLLFQIKFHLSIVNYVLILRLIVAII